MSITIDIEENPDVRVSEEVIDANPPDRIRFTAEGMISITEPLLGEFAGASLRPVRVDVSLDDARTVETDLEERASLRLDTVDVGVETPDSDDISRGMSSLSPSTDEATESTDPSPGVIAFTVEGTIEDVPAASFEPIADGSPTLKSITFAVGKSPRTDGGSDDDAVFEFTLLGYGIVVRRDGTIEIGTGIGIPDVELPR